MSIKQNTYPDGLPDFRNLGVTARILVAVNLVALVAAAYAETGWREAIERFVHEAGLIEPTLITSLAVLYLFGPRLARLPHIAGYALPPAVALAVVTGFALLGSTPAAELPRIWLFTALVTTGLAGYLRLRVKAFSPALAEARLQALQARIRPHFLFNSLNAVLSLIRRDPKRAELALEDLADVFRSLVSDGRRFVRLADEIALLERYANLEQLRLGERLRVTWDIDNAPQDALLPPLVLQPLLENAVYHGVEPGTGVGDVLVQIERHGTRVRVRLVNPCPDQTTQRPGSHMALDNLRERLQLFFDAEANIDTRSSDGRFEVQIEFPHITERAEILEEQQ